MDVDQARRILVAALPDLPIRSVEVMDEGWESLVLDVNGVLIAKFPRGHWAAEKYRREQKLLDAIGDRLGGIALPRPRLIEGEALIQVYDKLAGAMLTETVEADIDRTRIGAQLGRCLKDLHTLDDATVARTGLDPDRAVRWVERWRTLAARLDADLLPSLSERARGAAQRFLATTITDELGAFRPAITHGDVGGWNILVDARTSTVTALIDWGDADMGDPAYDFTAIRADHTRALFEALVAGYGAPPDEGFSRRIETYARLYPLYSAMVAREVGRADYAEKYLAMAERTFGVD